MRQTGGEIALYIIVFSDVRESCLFSDSGTQMQVPLRLSSRTNKTVSQYQKPHATEHWEKISCNYTGHHNIASTQKFFIRSCRTKILKISRSSMQ